MNLLCSVCVCVRARARACTHMCKPELQLLNYLNFFFMKLHMNLIPLKDARTQYFLNL